MLQIVWINFVYSTIDYSDHKLTKYRLMIMMMMNVDDDVDAFVFSYILAKIHAGIQLDSILPDLIIII